MQHKQAAKSIIENIQMLEQANAFIFDVLHLEVFKAIDKVILERVEQFEDEMIGIYDFHDKGEFFLSKEWEKPNFDVANSKSWDENYAYYALTNEGVSDKENHWWLSNFFENDLDIAVFNFDLERKSFENGNKKEWKLFTAAMNDKYTVLEQLGFKFNPEGNWYLPITALNQKEVADNYVSDTLEDALTPIKDALNILEQAHPIFKEIVQHAIVKFGRIDNEE